MSEQPLIGLHAEEIERVVAPLDLAWTLPPAAYTEPSIFNAECTRIFQREWICVARSEQVPNPGDFLSADLPGQPIVITRDTNGDLHALSRICLHRAMPLVAGMGNAKRFVCPYHNWTYELDGRLRSAPMMTGAREFEPETCRLPELGLEEWNGFVFVNLDRSAPPLGPRLEKLDDLIRNYHFEDLRIVDTVEFGSPWNWKILVENFMEAYHHIGTHRTTLEPTYAARDAVVHDNGGEPWAFLEMPGRTDHQDSPVVFEHLTDTERRGLFAAVVMPTLLIAASAGGGVWYQLEPHAHDAMRLRIHLLMPSALAPLLSTDDVAAFRSQVVAIHGEDIEANQGPWLGLHGALTRQGRLSPAEKAIWQLNQYWVERLTW